MLQAKSLTDNFGRTIDYLRLSVTDRCNLNCTYCKHAAYGAEKLISFSEITRAVRLFAACGIRKIRLTGGEPLVRGDICDIVRSCKETAGVLETVLTTNGILLPEMAAGLKEAGLCRVNVSIDSLNPKQYKQIARAESLGRALEGVDAAIRAGLTPVKINAVLMRGVNDDEMGDYIALAEKKDVQVRFIEYMPMGKAREGRYLSADEAEGRMPECKGKIDFITPVSRPFCRQCNRIRVTADCRIRHCLGNNTETDLREILQQDDKTAIELIRAAVLKKPEKGFSAGFETDRGMGNIGG